VPELVLLFLHCKDGKRKIIFRIPALSDGENRFPENRPVRKNIFHTLVKNQARHLFELPGNARVLF
jgi:hypothetical protein